MIFVAKCNEKPNIYRFFPSFYLIFTLTALTIPNIFPKGGLTPILKKRANVFRSPMNRTHSPAK